MTPSAVDREVVERHLVAIEEAVDTLRRFQNLAAEALSADVATRWAIERGLLLCTQNALDVAAHVLAATGREAREYAQVIDALGRSGVLPAAFAARFRGVAGFRNVLVHAYLDVDPTIVHDVLVNHLDEFVAFATHIQRWLDRDAPGTSGSG